jgi:hypothetical protein
LAIRNMIISGLVLFFLIVSGTTTLLAQKLETVVVDLKEREFKKLPYIQIIIKITGKDSKEPVCIKSERLGLSRYVEVLNEI